MDDAFRDPDAIARFARAAVDGGAAGIRAEGYNDVRAIRHALAVLIIGIKKDIASDGKILITPSFDAAEELVRAGADMIALDCTKRGQDYGALERIAAIKEKLKVPVLADIAAADEARAAEQAGADCVLSTMRGYTTDTEHLKNKFDVEFIAELKKTVAIPVIAEGRIWTPDEARSAIAAGAFAVIVGTAITRPHEITRRFVNAIEKPNITIGDCVIGIDIGGTNIKSGIVTPDGTLTSTAVDPTPRADGPAAVVSEIKRIVAEKLAIAEKNRMRVSAVGVATAGWIDPRSGKIIFASENIPGWTGTDLGAELRGEFPVPFAFENDANAAAIGEHRFGAAQGVSDFFCITLGTGLGCGIFARGNLLHGANSLACEMSHIQLEPNGLLCNCGKTGCLEIYTNAAALVREAGAEFASAKDVVQAAATGNAVAVKAIETLADNLARGCSMVVMLFDPSLILLSGGVSENNPLLFAKLREGLENRLLAYEHRGLRIERAANGYFSGVIGAAAAALDRAEY